MLKLPTRIIILIIEQCFRLILFIQVKNFDSLIHDDFADFFTFGISTVKVHLSTY